MWDGDRRGIACRINAVVAVWYQGPCSEFRQAGLGAVLHAIPAPPRKASGPNKTEDEYRRTYLRGLDARYEAITFRMANGHKYTPDWVVFDQGGEIVSCHECKGGYALHSQQRARLAFDQCAAEFPAFKWTWAVKKPEGWEITHAKA